VIVSVCLTDTPQHAQARNKPLVAPVTQAAPFFLPTLSALGAWNECAHVIRADTMRVRVCVEPQFRLDVPSDTDADIDATSRVRDFASLDTQSPFAAALAVTHKTDAQCACGV
jgi:hypothetical protein